VIQKIPTLRMITLPLETIEKRVFDFKKKLQKNIPDHIKIQIIGDVSQVGGGALPSQELPTKVIAITSKSISVQNLEKRFRENTPPIIARIHKDQLRIDLRTVDESEEEYLIATITSL